MTVAEDLEHPHFRAALIVTSSALSLAELTQALGREPDPSRSRDHGDMLRYPVRPATHARWSLELAFDDDVHRGCYGLSDAIVGLGDELADRIIGLAPRIADVALSVEQHLDPGDLMTDGIHLEVPAIAWLARVGAYVDIDQYTKEATFRDALHSWGGARMWNLRELRWAARRRSRAIPVIRRLVPVGPEERDEVPVRVWRGADHARRAEAKRWQDAIDRRRDEDAERAAEVEHLNSEEWSDLAVLYVGMLSLVAKGGRASRKDSREGHAALERASASVAHWPDRWNLLREADDFLRSTR